MTRALTLVETAELVAAEIADGAVTLDRAGVFPAANFRRLHEAGLLGITAPRSLGGRGAGVREAGEVVGAIAKAEPSTALILAMQYIQLGSLPKGSAPASVVATIVNAAIRDGALINALRVEPELGTPLRGGLAGHDGAAHADGWSISGRKIYSTGADRPAAGAIVWARTDEPRPRGSAASWCPSMPTAFASRRPGIRSACAPPVAMTSSSSECADSVRPRADIRPPSEWDTRGDGTRRHWFGMLPGSLYTGVARSGPRLAGALPE